MKIKETSAKLRITLESVDPFEMLEGMTLSGARFITGIRQPTTREWLEVRTSRIVTSEFYDCMANSDRVYSYNLDETCSPSVLDIKILTDNGSYRCKVDIGPMGSGSELQLDFCLMKGGLFLKGGIKSVLQEDGTFTRERIRYKWFCSQS